MRLHRTISPDQPLLVVALEEEATHLHVSGLPVLITGAGKVNAAVALATTLAAASPSEVINLGTAGALRPGVEGTHLITMVTQHDLDDAALFALTGLHFSEPIHLSTEGAVLTTGDAFIADAARRTELAAHADLVDMEGYAVARVCQTLAVPMRLVKQVSDKADGSAGKSWGETVDECAEVLGAWVRTNL